MDPALHTDPQEQLHSLCKSLVKRQQNLGEFNMLANAILHFNDFPKAAGKAGSK